MSNRAWRQLKEVCEDQLTPEQRERLAKRRADRWLARQPSRQRREFVKFDPNQPRDEDGKWTSGGGDGGGGSGPAGFVSPNVGNLTFDQAVSALGSKGQANLKKAGEFIDGKLGILATTSPVIGAWADGAENSMMVVASGASAEQMRAAMAMKGWLGDQKSVLMFEPKQGGDAFMASFDVNGKAGDVHAQLLKDGLAFHTLEPRGGDNIRVHIYGSDQETIDSIGKAAGDKGVRFVQGSGEFLGTTKETGSDREQRDDARRVYEQAIREISDSGKLAGRDLDKIWGEARDYWQSVSGEKALALLLLPEDDDVIEARRLAVLDAVAKLETVAFFDELQLGPPSEWFNGYKAKKESWEDQPRVPAGSPEGGQFGHGGGGGGAGGDGAKPAGTPMPTNAPGTVQPKPHERPGKFDTAKVEGAAKEGVARGTERARANNVKPLAGSSGHPNLIATRYVTGKGLPRDVYTRPDVAGMQQNSENFAHDTALFKNADFYPNFRASDLQGKSPDEIVTAVKDHMKENLKLLYNESKDASDTKLWYDGARIMVDDRAERYGLNDASVAGVYAALSPQKLWDANVYLGDRLIDIYQTKQDHVWDDKMQATAEQIWKPKDQPLVDRVKGKSLSELTTATEKAMWIRTYDEANSNRNYHIVKPDGSFGELAKNKDGSLATAAWQTLPMTANAVKALEANGDSTKLAEAFGDRHKVRSFYNNILDPHSANHDVTVDTHAVGAALLRPLGGSDVPVAHVLATTPKAGKKPVGWEAASASAVTGSKGLYPIYADAVREAASELGLQPRQLQSITWETKRTLFDVGDKQKAAVEAVWRTYHNDPTKTLADTQNDILEILRTKTKAILVSVQNRRL